MKKWSEVEQSKEYQTLPADQKEKARNQYFSDIIAPQIPEDKRSAAKLQFDADTASKKAPTPTEEEPLLKTALKKGIGYLQEQKKGGEEILGSIAEPVMKMASGAVAKPISEIAGLAATGYEAATGGKNAQSIPGFQKDVQEKLTYEPKTMAGKSEYNPLNAIPMAVGKAVNAITPEKTKEGSADTAIGMIRNAAAEAIPQAVGIAGAKIAPKASVPVEAAGKALRSGHKFSAEELMQSAIKPIAKDLKSGDAAKAIDTMLDKGINATKGGIDRIRARIDQLNDQIKNAIADSPSRVETARIARPVVEKLQDLRKQVNPNADVAALKKSWSEFKNHPLLQHETPEKIIPTKIDPQTGAVTPGKVIPASGKEDMSVQTAQELKQGTYKQLSKKYGQMASAEDETQKTIARGLKEEIAKKVPEIVGLNAEESKLFNVLDVAERRILMEGNKNPMGLSLLAGNPEAWAAFMADRSALFKSLAARMANAASKKLKSAASSGGPQGATTAMSAAVPSQTEKEKRKQYAMSAAQ